MALTPFLMFSGRAEEAIRFYEATFPRFEIVDLERNGPGGPGVEGSVKKATIKVEGQSLMINDSPVEHAFGFTPAVSFYLDFATVAQLDTIFDLLSEGGEVLMPRGEYPFARRFAWISDRYGVSWQLSVPY
jgi:predicted 3-demethylubiquinone-9 3-methyltransferase (glyoxalase superfamily)